MGRSPGKRDLSTEQRGEILLFLAERYASSSGILARGAIKAAVARFDCSRNTISHLWRDRHTIAPRPSRGRPRLSAEDGCVTTNIVRIEAVPRSRRQSLRALSYASGVPKTTLIAYLRRGLVRRFRSRVKPALTTHHELRRLAFALTHVTVRRSLSVMHHMYDRVHIDEKWFNLYKSTTTYYLTANEPAPYRSSPNKRYIGKVMFIAAVARPRYDYSKKCIFDGKIGLWPIIETATAKRTSKNRIAGTPVIKCINLTRSVYWQFLIEKVFPAIRSQWPGVKSRTVYVQQDNAGPHAIKGDVAVRLAGLSEDWKLKMMRQPPRSPDFNVLDLGFFNSIQSLQYQEDTYTLEQLISAVQRSFARVSYETLDKCFFNTRSYDKIDRAHWPK